MARGLDVKITSDQGIRKALELLVDSSGVGVLDDVASVILRRNRARFLKGVNPDNVRWPESESAKRRAQGLPDSQGIRRVGSTGNTLFSTGSLFESIQVLTSQSTRNRRVVGVNPAFTNRVTGKRVIDYARKHQFGRDGLPERKFLGVNNEDTAVVNQVIQFALTKLG